MLILTAARSRRRSGASSYCGACRTSTPASPAPAEEWRTGMSSASWCWRKSSVSSCGSRASDQPRPTPSWPSDRLSPVRRDVDQARTKVDRLAGVAGRCGTTSRAARQVVLRATRAVAVRIGTRAKTRDSRVPATTARCTAIAPPTAPASPSSIAFSPSTTHRRHRRDRKSVV